MCFAVDPGTLEDDVSAKVGALTVYRPVQQIGRCK